MENKFTYSVIIPFRDQLHLLELAVKSILDREDIQVIIIDNSKKSLESSFNWVHDKAELLYLTSNPNGGAGCARNLGLKAARGKWLLFLDSDDYFLPDAFDSFDKYAKSDYDIVFFNKKSVMLSTGQPSNRANKSSELVVNNKLDILRYRNSSPCSKMIKHDIVTSNQIEFEEIRVSNDTRFSYMVGAHANRVIADPTIVYCVTESEKDGSLSYQINPENEFLHYKAAVDRNTFLESIGHSEFKAVLIHRIISAIKLFGIKEGFRYFNYARKYRQNVLGSFKSIWREYILNK